jgi:flagellar hook-associated protein 2
MSTINSLGIGSGVLTSDLVDQLKAADEATILKPLENKISLDVQKEDAYNLLESLMTTLKSSFSTLDGDNLYLSRSVTGNSDAVTVSAESGSNTQAFSITDVSLAKADVWNSTALSTKSTPIADLGAGTLTLSVDGEDFDIEYDANSSLNDIRDSINEVASDSMTASVLQVGPDSYKLVLTAKDTNKAITFSDSNANTVSPEVNLTTALGLSNIQTAKPATFKYNGVDVTRDTNNITDLISGVTIKLNENQEPTDVASINIVQNTTSISSEMSLFVSSYNSLMTNLQDMTRSNRDSGSVGIFNGESFVKSISRELANLVTSVDGNGNSLMDYGIDIDRYGVMSLDSSVFNEKLNANPQGLELFFSGNSETEGIFTKLNNKMSDYTSYGKLLSNFSDQLTSSKENTISQYDKQKASLESRYEILTKKFIAYDAMISKLNSAFSSMQMMIDQSYGDSNN